MRTRSRRGLAPRARGTPCGRADRRDTSSTPRLDDLRGLQAHCTWRATRRGAHLAAAGHVWSAWTMIWSVKGVSSRRVRVGEVTAARRSAARVNRRQDHRGATRAQRGQHRRDRSRILTARPIRCRGTRCRSRCGLPRVGRITSRVDGVTTPDRLVMHYRPHRGRARVCTWMIEGNGCGHALHAQRFTRRPDRRAPPSSWWRIGLCDGARDPHGRGLPSLHLRGRPT